MIEELIINNGDSALIVGLLLFILKKIFYLNHKITLIESKLKSCGIVALEEEAQAQDHVPPP